MGSVNESARSATGFVEGTVAAAFTPPAAMQKMRPKKGIAVLIVREEFIFSGLIGLIQRDGLD
jgi:hypothetical protein